MKEKTLNLLYLFLLSYSLHAGENTKYINEQLNKVVEKKVFALISMPSSKTKEEVIKILGRPDHISDKRISYIRNKYKFAIHITFYQERISKIEYKITKEKKLRLKDFTPFINKEKLKLFPENDNHKRDQYLVYPFNNLLLYFHNNSKQTLTKIVYEK